MAQSPIAWLVLLLPPRGSRRGVFWDGLYLALPIAMAPCTLIPSHKAAATLGLYSTSIGKVGSQDIALSHGYLLAFKTRQKETLKSNY